ncbi:disease resistance protein RPV1-like [Rhododendron vialii]|uniref:disease resistance protein RPV1-like n=1 Tax=Rhododendron vialii TaxID=182163 RepID=UPI00265FFA6A|nr:disease resistance protein RPV1-like [Rhododendron vialii]
MSLSSTMKSQEASSSNSRHPYEVFQEASPSNCGHPYDVFLSFRGKDTRKAFTGHLYNALDVAGFRTFRDDDEVEKGEEIKFELKRAIRESRMSIIVFSKSYASSTWCLDELVMIMKKRRTSRHEVLPVFYDVDPSDVRKQNVSFKEAFTSHETGERKEELKDKVGPWRAALAEVAGLAGMDLSQAEGNEASFIKKIVTVVEDKLSRTMLDIFPHLVGIDSRVKNIQLWLEDGQRHGPINFGIVAICGMGGIGKTTIAKYLYNLISSKFEGSCCFLADVRENSQTQDDLLGLQRKLLSAILKKRETKINSIDEGTAKIRDAMSRKKVFVVLDDVDTIDQFDAILGTILGMRDWLFRGSKIIITTRHEELLGANEFYKVHRVKILSHKESLELFSWHAFGKCCPNNGYGEVSERAVSYCGGLPLAVKVVGASLSGKGIHVWESRLQKLKAIPDGKIHEKLKISYDSLPDDHDKNLFIHLACLFINDVLYLMDDNIITILDSCGFYTMVGIQTLMDRCLLSIDEHSKLLKMHQLLQEMGRQILRDRESSKALGERTILWNQDALIVLSGKTGTDKVEGLTLHMGLCKEDENGSTDFGANRKRCCGEFLGQPFLANFCRSLKRYGFNIFSSSLEATGPETLNQKAFEADAFGRMHKLKFLKLQGVHINGPYKMLPKGLKYLRWNGFLLNSIPSDFPLENLTALDMSYSSLKNVWEGTRFLELLKTLNLSHSPNLVRTPDFLGIPNLERLFLHDCRSLVEVHESIGSLERLVSLDLRDCKSLRKLPRSIGKLKHLESLNLSGCPNLDELPTNTGSMDSQSPSASGEVNAMQSFFPPWLLKPRESPEISRTSLSQSLVKLNLADCNLSDDDFPRDLGDLCSLEYLNLARTQISSLPDFIRGLTRLVVLDINGCPRLRKLEGLPQVDTLIPGNNPLLEEVTVQVFYCSKTSGRLDTCDHVDKPLGVFKIEPIENVAAEITQRLGLSNLQSIGKQNVKISTRYGMNQRKLPLQGCHERHIFSAYLPGSNVPEWFSFKNLGGSSVDFTVPSNPNSRVRGLSICSVYELSCAPLDYRWEGDQHTIVSNKTKGLVWSYCPGVFGVGEAGEDMMWLSYWKYGKQLLEAGDELHVSVFGGPCVLVKEVGVCVLYNEEQEAEFRAIHGKAPMEELPEAAMILMSSRSDINEEQAAELRAIRGKAPMEELPEVTMISLSSQSDNEENVSHQIYQFGNIITGNVSAHQPRRTKLYQIGLHGDRCEYCQEMYPRPWITAMSRTFWDTECWAPRLLVLPSYYVSDSLRVEEDLAQQETSHCRAMSCKPRYGLICY